MRRRDLPTEIHADAPMRLDFAGGWTDVPPFSAREGGVVVNGAIDLRAHVHVRLGGEVLRFVSEELGETLEFANSGGLAAGGGGKLPLLKAALRMFPVLGGFTLTTRSDAPPGSGLGSSGALGVALVAALTRARQETRAERECAEQAWQVEAVEADLPGGKQDQYAAALGGFHRLSFRDPDVGIEPLTLEREFAVALARQTLVCYTNKSRVSGDTISRVMQGFERGDPLITRALHGIKAAGDAMVEALRRGDLVRVANLLSENWKHQQALDSGMRTQEMARLEQAAAAAGALGGKAAGAGAGGSMFFIMKGDARDAAGALTAAGGRVLPVSWAAEGVRSW